MGWLITYGASKADIIADLTRETDYRRTVRHSVRGNTLYQAVQLKSDGSLHLEIDLLRGDRGYGWGYKDLCEEMGPCEVDCPLYLLDLVPCPDSDYARNWRVKVRAHHAARNARRREARFKAKRILAGTPVAIAGGIRLSGGRVNGPFTLAWWKGENAIVRTNQGLVRVKADRVTVGA